MSCVRSGRPPTPGFLVSPRFQAIDLALRVTGSPSVEGLFELVRVTVVARIMDFGMINLSGADQSRIRWRNSDQSRTRSEQLSQA
jgi:hypothetical protein